MIQDIRISRVEVIGPSLLSVVNDAIHRDKADLGGWVATGGGILAPLRDPEVFALAGISDHGATVTWDDGEGDLSIDATHLKMIADEQKPFSNEALRQWQSRVNISNSEAADFVGVSPSTWATYRVEATIPQVVGMTLRAAERDPLLLQAHLRPRRTGRPRKENGPTP